MKRCIVRLARREIHGLQDRPWRFLFPCIIGLISSQYFYPHAEVRRGIELGVKHMGMYMHHLLCHLLVQEGIRIMYSCNNYFVIPSEICQIQYIVV